MIESQRTKKTILNISYDFVFAIIEAVLTFILKTIFIMTLGKEYLGIKGLFSNILSMLSLTELGISTAISFSLYKPLAEEDSKKISILMSFYKKAYRIIGTLIFTIGIIIMFFLKYLIKDGHNIEYLNLIYVLFLLNTVSSYFLSYKQTLLKADQKKYKLTKINFIFLFVGTIIEISLLLIFKNYILFLIFQIGKEILKKVVINRFISKEYKNVNFKEKEKLDKEDKDNLKRNIKALMMHKLGVYVLNGTDNIVASAFIGLSIVGVYSNYISLTEYIVFFIDIIYKSITAGFGNLIASIKNKENEKKALDVFHRIDFIGFILYGISSICFLYLFNPFITLWIGQDYLLSFDSVIVIVLNYFFVGMRMPINTVRSAAGLYYQDRFLPVVQTIVNLVTSIILVQKIGFIGILIGSLVSNILAAIVKPYILYKYIFHTNVKDYYIRFIKYIFVILLVGTICIYPIQLLSKNIQIISVLIMAIVCVVVASVCIYIVYRKSEEFEYLKKLILNIIGKVKINDKKYNDNGF